MTVDTPGLVARTSQRPVTNQFRADIGALRAIAIVCVLLYHFNQHTLPGGFVGVDVFFVISGFLMTSIIVDELDQNLFSLTEFYVARARRITPALALLCSCLLLTGTLFIDPLTFQKLARDVLASLMFLSNIQYAFEDSYFAASSETNWLLHTWTLSVEWQFYILYPLALISIKRVKWLWKRRLNVAVICTVVLFCFLLWFSSVFPKGYQLSFFLLPMRAWELLAGGCVALARKTKLRPPLNWLLQGAGLLAIGFSAVFFPPTLPWPSAWTALPVVGTTAVIAANIRNPSWAANYVMQAIGTLSYSIYLWHWPILVGLRYWDVDSKPSYLVLGLILTLCLSAISYVLVEQRFSRFIFTNSVPNFPRKWLYATSLCVISVIAAIGWEANGFERARVSHLDSATRWHLEDYRIAVTDWLGSNPCRSSAYHISFGHICQFGPIDENSVAVLGDSHVEEMLPRYSNRVGSATGITFIYQDGCLPFELANSARADSRCSEFARSAFELLSRSSYRTLIIAPAWAAYFEDASGSLTTSQLCFNQGNQCRLAGDWTEFSNLMVPVLTQFGSEIINVRKRGTVVILTEPDLKSVTHTAASLYRRTFFAGHPILIKPLNEQEFQRHYIYIRDLLVQISHISGAKLFDPLPTECDVLGRCSLYVGGEFLFKDGHHVRASIIRSLPIWYMDVWLDSKPRAVTVPLLSNLPSNR